MENVNELKIGIGNEEAVILKPGTFKIMDVIVQEIVTKNNTKNKKVVCLVKHPDVEKLIQISSIKYENREKLEVAGLWLNKDSKGLIRKDSPLAVFMKVLGANTIEEMKNKEWTTITDDNNYLVFKCY